MRDITFERNKLYCLQCRGTNEQEIFIDDFDYARFLFLLLYFQSPIQINNTSWYTNAFMKKNRFSIGNDKIKDVIKNRYIELLSFAILPNRFYILIKNIDDMIASVYMHRVLTAYSKSFNSKYKKSGHVFDGPFKAIPISSSQVVQTSAFIHKTPSELDGGKIIDYEKYKWSSCIDFLESNRWDKLLITDTILRQFKNSSSYKDFISNNSFKPLI